MPAATEMLPLLVGTPQSEVVEDAVEVTHAPKSSPSKTSRTHNSDMAAPRAVPIIAMI